MLVASGSQVAMAAGSLLSRKNSRRGGGSETGWIASTARTAALLRLVVSAYRWSSMARKPRAAAMSVRAMPIRLLALLTVLMTPSDSDAVPSVSGTRQLQKSHNGPLRGRPKASVNSQLDANRLAAEQMKSATRRDIASG